MTTLAIPGLPLVLAAEGSPPCRYQLAGAALRMTSGPGSDMFVDPAGAAAVPDAGRLVGTPPDGDFRLAARVTVGFASDFDAGVLLVHAGERQWAKLCLEYSPQHKPMAVTVVTRGTSDDCNSFEVEASTLWLRITRKGRAWAFHAGQDGQRWSLLRYFRLDAPDEPGAAGALNQGHPASAVPFRTVRVGFLAQSPAGQGCTATFDHLTLRPGSPANLRDGS